TAGGVEPAAADLDEAAVEGDGAAAALRGDDTTACPHRGAVSVLTDGLLLGRGDPAERTRGLGDRVVVVRGHRRSSRFGVSPVSSWRRRGPSSSSPSGGVGTG